MRAGKKSEKSEKSEVWEGREGETGGERAKMKGAAEWGGGPFLRGVGRGRAAPLNSIYRKKGVKKGVFGRQNGVLGKLFSFLDFDHFGPDPDDSPFLQGVDGGLGVFFWMKIVTTVGMTNFEKCDSL
ncbi:MAG: hypothetical protein ABSF38_18560 [Verrucomicrobiota bacterium]|jgi:hypothetical protein